MSQKINPAVSKWAKIAVLGMTYYAAARLGLSLHSVSGFATLIWPPSGLALAALLLGGTNLWPGIFIAAASINLSVGASLPVALVIGIGNTLEALVAVWLLRRFDFSPSLSRLKDLTALIVLAAGLSTTISASLGTFVLWISGTIATQAFFRTWGAWWIGDAIGDLVFAPLLLIFFTFKPHTWGTSRHNILKILEGTFLTAVLVAICLIVFELPVLPFHPKPPLLPHVLFPCLVWAALRFKQSGVIAANFIVFVIAVIGTHGGNGPFATPSMAQSLATLQTFIAIIVITSLVLTTVLTERSQSLLSLAASRQRLELIQKAALVASWDWDIHADRITWHGAVEQVFGFKAPNYRTWRNRVHQEDRAIVQNAIDVAIRENTEYKADFRYILPNGKVRWLTGRGKVFYKGGIPQRMLGINLDITDLKLAEAAVKDSEERHRLTAKAAEEANRAKSAFLANMSHEIRTPLGAIIGFSDLLVNSQPTLEERDHYVEVIKRNGDHLSNIINDILDLSKIEAGKLEIEKTLVSLQDIVTDMTSLLSLQAQHKGLRFSVTCDKALPQFIRTDRLRLRQILLNIVGNAIKFTSKGFVEINIKTIGYLNARSKLAFIVKDSGPGIDKKQIERLFKPFTQGDISATRKHGGTGLGLVLSQRLARALGGDIKLAQSTVGKGSTFVVTIDYNDNNVGFPVSPLRPEVRDS